MTELIVALDVCRRDADRLVERLGPKVSFYKIGYQLAYGGNGLALARDLAAAGKRVFLDLKLLDIDHTIEKAVEAIAETGAAMTTVHCYPGALAAAVHAARGTGLQIIAVTVLTSMNDSDVAAAGYRDDVSRIVAMRARQAKLAGAGGIVASVRESTSVKDIVGSMMIVVPGIHLLATTQYDQKRTGTPIEAARAGATHIVVGRAIVDATDPELAVEAVHNDLEYAVRPPMETPHRLVKT